MLGLDVLPKDVVDKHPGIFLPAIYLLAYPQLAQKFIEGLADAESAEAAVQNDAFNEFSQKAARGEIPFDKLLERQRPDEYTEAWWKSSEAREMMMNLGIRVPDSEEEPPK